MAQAWTRNRRLRRAPNESANLPLNQNPLQIRKLSLPLRPIARWWWMEIPNASAALAISLVISMSSRGGLGSPEGWLCTVPRESEFPLLCRDLGDFQSALGSWSGACFSCLLVIFNCQSRPCLADTTRTRSSTDSESQGRCIQSPPSITRPNHQTDRQ